MKVKENVSKINLSYWTNLQRDILLGLSEMTRHQGSFINYKPVRNYRNSLLNL